MKKKFITRNINIHRIIRIEAVSLGKNIILKIEWKNSCTFCPWISGSNYLLHTYHFQSLLYIESILSILVFPAPFQLTQEFRPKEGIVQGCAEVFCIKFLAIHFYKPNCISSIFNIFLNSK